MHRQSCLPSKLTVAAPDAFGRIPGVLTQHVRIGLTVDLNTNGNHFIIKGYLSTKFEASGAELLTYLLYKVWDKRMIFDLNINRKHLLVKENLHVSTKFEASWAKDS